MAHAAFSSVACARKGQSLQRARPSWSHWHRGGRPLGRTGLHHLIQVFGLFLTARISNASLLVRTSSTLTCVPCPARVPGGRCTALVGGKPRTTNNRGRGLTGRGPRPRSGGGRGFSPHRTSAATPTSHWDFGWCRRDVLDCLRHCPPRGSGHHNAHR